MLYLPVGELRKVFASRKRNPQALRDIYAKNQFNCHNCLYGVNVYRQICPVRCRRKKNFVSEVESRKKCEYYIPDYTIDKQLRRILITIKFQEKEQERKELQNAHNTNRT